LTWHEDTVLALDRVFYVRVLPAAVDAARSAAQIIELGDRAPGEHWFVVLADSPGDARTHMYRALTGVCRDRECGCPATTCGVDDHEIPIRLRALETLASALVGVQIPNGVGWAVFVLALVPATLVGVRRVRSRIKPSSNHLHDHHAVRAAQ